MNIELVVFDLLGTMVRDDESVAACLRAALIAADVSVTAPELRAVAGLGTRDALRMLLAHNRLEPAEWSDSEIDRLHAIFRERLMTRLATRELAEEMGASAALRRLMATGLRVAIETELERDIAMHVLDRTGWLARGLVDVLVTRDEVKRGRPFGDGIALAMDRAGITDAEQVVKVGRNIVDIEQAFAAGCELAIGIADDAAREERLRAHRAPYVLPTVALVPELLARLRVHAEVRALAAGRR